MVRAGMMKVLLGIGAILLGGLFVWVFLAFRSKANCADTICNPSPLFPFLTSGHVYYGLALIAAMLISSLVAESALLILLSLTIVGGIFYDLWYHQYAH
jgi:hypothetical protein